MPVLFLGFGLVAVLLLLSSDRIGERSAVADLELLKAVGEIQLDTAISHLWLEEYVTGDAIDVLDVYESLDRARSRVRGLLGNGGGTGVSGDGLKDSVLERRAVSLEANIEEFRRISFARQIGFEKGLEVGIGSPLDRRYDAVFRQVLDDGLSLQTSLEARMLLDRQRGRLVLTWILVGWGLLVTAATVGLWNHERRRHQAEVALQASQEQLLQSQKLEALGRLASGLAHDLNNYLAAVRGHCELVEMRRVDDPWVVGKMQAAIRGVQRSSSLIEQLRSFGRRRPEQAAIVDLNGIVRGLETVVGPFLGERVSLELDLAPDLGAVTVDPGQMEQVLVNLVLNAQEAMGGQGIVRISTENLQDGDGEVPEVLLSVADSGQGVAAEIRDSLFEPFVSTRSGDGRRGLGLAMVYSIVRGAEGSIDFESEAGKGTIFRVILPRSASEAPPQDLGEGEGEDLRGSETILLVDDNEELRQALGDLLEAYGYRVLMAKDANAALELCLDQEIDLVLADVVLPGLSGPEAVERIRRHRDLPALFMTGHGEGVAAEHPLPPDAGPVLSKMIAGTALLSRLRWALDAWAARAESP